MSYRNAVYDYNGKQIVLYTWDEQGNRVEKTFPFSPYLYVEDRKSKDAISIYETHLKKMEFENSAKRRAFVDSCKDRNYRRLFFNLPPEQQFLIEQFQHVYKQPDFTKNPLKIYSIDIEVFCPDEFPHPDEAKHPINLITVHDSLSNKFYTWGLLNDYTPTDPTVTYIKMDTEQEMLQAFLKFWRADFPDVLTGWASEIFDIPYLINRINKLLGENKAEKLSPIGSVFSKEKVGRYGKKINKWFIKGVSCLDYRELYLYLARDKQEKYSLDYISNVELGEGKLTYNSSNLSKLSMENWPVYVEYNIQDVRLLLKLEAKLHYLYVARLLAYEGLTNFESALGKVSILSGAIALKALQKHRILSTFIAETDRDFEGGYVREINPCFKENIVTFDVNSLYPNTIVTLNISPETKIGRIVQQTSESVEIELANKKMHTLPIAKFKTFLDQEQIAISKAGILYTQKNKGVCPNFVDTVYKERVKYNKEKTKCEKAVHKLDKSDPAYNDLHEKIVYYDVLQYTLKILLNSLYGVFGNKHSAIYDVDAAESVTKTGQACIKATNDILDAFAREKYGVTDSVSYYSDTDSAHITIKGILQKKGVAFLNSEGRVSDEAHQYINEIDDHLNTEVNKWARDTLHSVDPRFQFKIEAICNSGLYQCKKHYILHIIEEKGLPKDDIKYVGVDVVKTTISKEAKVLIKKIVRKMLDSRDAKETTELYKTVYDEFKTFPLDSLCFRSGISDYEKFASRSTGFETPKGTPIHAKSSVYYNYLLDLLNLTGVHEKITSGSKIKYFYAAPNKYNIKCIAYLDKYPFEQHGILPDYELMFQKLIEPAVQRLYQCVNWQLKSMQNQSRCDLEALLGDDNDEEQSKLGDDENLLGSGQVESGSDDFGGQFVESGNGLD